MQTASNDLAYILFQIYSFSDDFSPLIFFFFKQAVRSVHEEQLVQTFNQNLRHVFCTCITHWDDVTEFHHVLLTDGGIWCKINGQLLSVGTKLIVGRARTS